MSRRWQRVLILSGLVIGVAIVALLAIIAYVLLSGDGGGADTEVAHVTPTAVGSPTATPTPRATPSPTPPPPTPSPEPEQPTPVVIIVREEAPPPTLEQPPPAQQPLQPTPISAEKWEALCSDLRAQAELHRIIWNALSIIGAPSDYIKESMLDAEKSVREVCEGLGLTPVLTQNLTTMCSQAGQWRQLILDGIRTFPSLAAQQQEQFNKLGDFIEKYCGG